MSGYRLGSQWIRLYSQAWFLAYETSIVILLRMSTLALGGKAAQTEGRRMIEEKLAAAVSLQARALTGGLGRTGNEISAKTLSHYRRKVRANRRRLLKTAKLSRP